MHVFDSTNRTEWNDYYDRLPDALRDIHFSFNYHHLYEANGDGKMILFVYEEESDFYFYPFLLRSVPGHATLKDIETVYGYTGPLCTTEDPVFLHEADQSFLNWCKKEKVISEFVRFNPLIGNERFMKNAVKLATIHLRDYVAVDLSKNYSSVEANYTPANKNKIRKAIKAGIVIEEDSQAKQFDSFVSIYLDNMKRLNAIPMYFFSDSFFRELATLTRLSGTLINARLNGEIIGSTVFLQDGQYGHYFLSSATEFGRKNAAGNLMLDHGIRWCKGKHLSKLHLGGGLTGDPDDPLLRFKQNFSSQTVAFFIGKRIHDEENYQKVIREWELANPVKAVEQKAILQRYRN